MQQYEKVAQSEQAQKLMGAVDQYSKKFGGLWKMIFFTCAACVSAAGVMSILVGIMTLAAPFDFVNYVYLTLFGLIMLAIDFPGDHALVRNFRYAIYHYALFMTRFVGRGIWYLFLGCMTVSALWDNSVCPLLGFILGAYLGAVAIISIVKGIRLSQKLERLRVKVANMGPDHWGQYIPPNGMSKLAFRDFAVELVNVDFSEDEQNYIVNALSFEVRSDDVISRDEFEEWVRGPGMTWL